MHNAMFLKQEMNIKADETVQWWVCVVDRTGGNLGNRIYKRKHLHQQC